MNEYVRPTVRLTPEQNKWIREQCQSQGISFQKYMIHVLTSLGMPKEVQEQAEGQLSLFDEEVK